MKARSVYYDNIMVFPDLKSHDVIPTDSPSESTSAEETKRQAAKRAAGPGGSSTDPSDG